MPLNPFDEALATLPEEEDEQTGAPPPPPAAPPRPPAPPPQNPLTTPRSAQPEPGISPYRAFLREQAAQKQGDLRAVIDEGQRTTTPQKRTEALQLADQYRLPVEMIERNFDYYKALNFQDKSVYGQFLQSSPKTVEWMRREPWKAAAALDDMRHLADSERTITFMGSMLRGWDNFQASAGRSAEALGEGGIGQELAAYGASVAKFNEEQARNLGYSTTWDDVAEDHGKFFQLVKEQLGENLPIMGMMITGAIAGRVVGGVLGMPLGPAGSAAFATVGGFLGAYVPAWISNVGEAQSALKQRDPDAKAGLSVFVGGSAAAALDVINPSKISGGLVRLFGKETAEQILQRTFAQPIKPQFLIGSVKEGFHGMLSEGFTEALQQGITEVAADMGIGQFSGWGNLFDQMISAGASGALVGGVTTSSIHGLTIQQQQRRWDVGAQQRVFVDALAGGASLSELAKRDPVLYQEVVAYQTANGPVETLFVEPAVWRTLSQSAGVSPELLAAQLTGKADALELAEQHGELLQIPTAAYAAQIAATELHPLFADEIRMRADLPSPRESRDALAQVAASAQKITEAMQAAANGTESPAAAASPLRQGIVAQLLADPQFHALATRARVDPVFVANVYAAGQAALIETVAAKLDKDPMVLMAEQGLTIGDKGLTFADAVAVAQGAAAAPPTEVEGTGAAETVLEQAARAKRPVGHPMDLNPARRRDGALILSTAKAGGPNAVPQDEPRITDARLVLSDPEKAAQAAETLRGWGLLTEQQKQGTDAQVIRAAIHAMKRNLRALWDTYPKAWQARAKEWYVGANIIVNRLAQQYSIVPEAAAGVIAVLSPKVDWFKNVSYARRVLSVRAHLNATNEAFTEALYLNFSARWKAATRENVKTYRKKKTKTEGQLRVYRRKRRLIDARVKELVGARWRDLDHWGQARMLRSWDEVNNSPFYQIISPEGEEIGLVTTKGAQRKDGSRKPGKPSKAGWTAYPNIERALSILDDPSVENISEQVGNEHKVRSFFNNMSHPWDPSSVTIDTHAVGAALLRPVSAESPQVKATFGGMGGPVSEATGLSGMNPIVAQAYFELAADLGVIPRETQSVTWEGIRSLFRPDQKRSKEGDRLAALAETLWAEVLAGNLTPEALLDKMLAEAGGYETPQWAAHPPQDQGTLADGGVLPRRHTLSVGPVNSGADAAWAYGSAPNGRGDGVIRGPAAEGARTLQQAAPPSGEPQASEPVRGAEAEQAVSDYTERLATRMAATENNPARTAEEVEARYPWVAISDRVLLDELRFHTAQGNTSTVAALKVEIAQRKREGHEVIGGEAARAEPTPQDATARTAYEELLSRLIAKEGFTYDALSGEFRPEGFALALFPKRGEIILVADVDNNTLIDYVERHVAVLRELGAGNHFGAWYKKSTGQVFLDVSRVIATPEEAEQLGREHEQIAYYDLAKGEEVTIIYPKDWVHGPTWQGLGGPGSVGTSGPIPDVAGTPDSVGTAEAAPGPDGQADVSGGRDGPAAAPGALGVTVVPTPDAVAGPSTALVATAPPSLLQTQPGELPPRGQIALGKGRAKITLFPDADLSTYLHETGHLYLQMLGNIVAGLSGKDPATLTAGEQALVRDYQRILTWLGASSTEALTEEQLEQFARGFEAYLMRGVAPTPALAPAFERYKVWLTKIYKQLTALKVDLTPEIIDVFDRLLATDAALAAAKAESNMKPFFSSAADARMDPIAWQGYQRLLAAWNAGARADLERQVLDELARERSAWWKARAEEIAINIDHDLGQQPVFVALDFLQKGQRPDGSPAPNAQRISRESIVEKYGEERLAGLPRPWVYQVDGGLDVDHAARLFGFSSGDEMLTALATAPDREQLVAERTAAQMHQLYGNMRMDGTLREQARQVVEEHGYERVLQAELVALAKFAAQAAPVVRAARAQEAAEDASARRAARAASSAAAVSNEALNEVAEERIGKLSARQINARMYWVAAQKAAAASAKAFADGNYERAVVEKQNQRLAVALHRAAVKALKEVDQLQRFATRLGARPAQARLGKAGESYQAQVNHLLNKYEFQRVSNAALDRRTSLMAWVAAREEEGRPVDIPAELMEAARATNYRAVPLTELRMLRDTLTQIVHLARTKNVLASAKDVREYTARRDELLASLAAHNKPRKGKLEYRNKDERRRSIEGYFAAHARLASIAAELDGFEDGGPMWQLFVRPLNAAADAEQARRVTDGRAFKKILAAYYPGRELARLAQMVHIPALDASLSREAILTVALNWGNQTSRDRLLADPARKWAQHQIDAILDQLDERDWRFVQSTFDFVNAYWQEISDKQFRLQGVRPEKVEAVPIVTKFGTIAGGYYPLAYDGRLSARGNQVIAITEAKLQLAGAYLSTTTRRGHEKTRLDNVQLPVRLELGVLFNHIDQVVHDLTHHEALIDVTRLIRDKKVTAALHGILGDVYYDQITHAIEAVAAPQRGTTHGLDKAAAFAKSGAQIAGLGLNLWTALQQPTGIFNGAARVGPTWVARGVVKWLSSASDTEGTLRWIHEVSPFMANRAQTQTQDILELGQRLGEPGGWFDRMVRQASGETKTQQDVTDAFMWHISLAQRVADVPTWLGQYEKSKAHGRSDADAVAEADQAVKDSQGGGQTIDLAAVQRGGPVARLFMVFYSYGAVVYNQTYRAAGRTTFTSPLSLARFLGELSMIYFFPALVSVLLSRLLRGSGEDDDDVYDVTGDVFKEMGSSALNSMVLVREFGGLLRSANRGYEGPAGMRLMQDLYAVARQLQQGEADMDLFKTLNNVGGIVLKYPSGQVQRSVDGFVALQEGETRNPLVLVFGAPRP